MILIDIIYICIYVNDICVYIYTQLYTQACAICTCIICLCMFVPCYL